MVRNYFEINNNVIFSVIFITLIYISNLISYVVSFEDYRDYFVALRYTITTFTILLALSNIQIIQENIQIYLASLFFLISSILTKNSFYLDISILILFSISIYHISTARLHIYLGLISIPIICLFCFIVLFTILGDLENNIFTQPESHLFSSKSSLGFINPNVISMLICSFTITLLAYKKYVTFLLFFIVFSISSIYLGSRTYIFALIFAISIFSLKKTIKKFNFLAIIALSLPLLVAISLYFDINSEHTLSLDLFLNGRIYGFNQELGNKSLFSFLFGFGDFEKIDSVYFNLILAFGIIGYSIIIIITYRLLTISKMSTPSYILSCSFLFICFFENIISVNSILSVFVIYQILTIKTPLKPMI